MDENGAVAALFEDLKDSLGEDAPFGEQEHSFVGMDGEAEGLIGTKFGER
jgi:hypothetical protein